MISNEDIIKRFETQETLEAVPSDMKRIVIACQGFEGAVPCTYKNWKGEEETTDGLLFSNPKDSAVQALKQANGVLVMYDGPGRQVKVANYLKEHPDAVKTAEGIQQLISYLKTEVVNDGGKPDLWDANTKFASNLKDGPALETIKPGQMIVSAKKQEVINAIYVARGVEFQGPAATPQVAGEGGAYIIREAKGDDFSYRMVQADVFKKAYEITKLPAGGGIGDKQYD